MFAILRFDGASRGNPGKGASAAVLFDRDGGVLQQAFQRHGRPVTNNEAEYSGLLAGLNMAHHIGVKRLTVEGDSKLVIEQVFGKWECRHARMRALHAAARALVRQFESADGRWIPREKNHVADALCNKALDTKASMGSPDWFWPSRNATSSAGSSAGSQAAPRPMTTSANPFGQWSSDPMFSCSQAGEPVDRARGLPRAEGVRPATVDGARQPQEISWPAFSGTAAPAKGYNAFTRKRQSSILEQFARHTVGDGSGA